MFENNFNFNMDKETVSEEIRKLLSEKKACSTEDEFDYLSLWKSKILELSGNN